MAKGKRETKHAKNAATPWIIIAVVLGVLALCAFGFCVYVDNATGIYPGVTVEGLSLGGMSPLEAEQALIASGVAQRESRSLTVTLPGDNLLVIDGAEACPLPQASGLARAAYRYGREKTLIGAAAAWVKSALRGEEIAAGGGGFNEEYIRAAVREAARKADEAIMDSAMTVGEDSLTLVKGVSQVLVDEDALCAGVMSALEQGDYSGFRYTPELRADDAPDLTRLHDTFCRTAADAFYDREKGVVPEVVGLEFDLQNAQMLWNDALPGEKVVIPLIRTEPELTAEWLKAHLFADVLGEQTSSLTTSSAARVNNVEVACAAIDGTVLMPGEEFSYNTALGKRTEEAGYKPAGAYLNGEVVTEIGGGICQVSSTLYCAALYADLKITARTNHYFGVDYLPAGMDATVSWGGPEFKFVNNREYPVRISAAVDREKWNMKVTLLGTDTDGGRVEIETEWKEFEDGYGTTTFRCVYDADGELLSRKREAVSRYFYHKEEEEEETPEETTEDTPEEIPEETTEETPETPPETPPEEEAVPPEQEPGNTPEESPEPELEAGETPEESPEHEADPWETPPEAFPEA